MKCTVAFMSRKYVTTYNSVDKEKMEIGTESVKTRSKQNYEIEILVVLGYEWEGLYSLCKNILKVAQHR